MGYGRQDTVNKKASSRSFQDLIVWKKSHDFVLTVYKASKSFPSEERFGLQSQFRRAAISIPANIAEGFKKYGTKDKIRYFNIAQGSLEECRYYLILSRDLDYIDSYEDLDPQLDEVGRLLFAYIKTIRKTVISINDS